MACRVLVVEDEILIRHYVITVLKQLGCIVAGEASSGEEAVAESQRLKPDLILMDIRLKGKMDGIETAKTIEKTVKVPLIFMSAFDYHERVKQENIANAVGYLNKPVDAGELESYIDRIPSCHQSGSG